MSDERVELDPADREPDEVPVPERPKAEPWEADEADAAEQRRGAPEPEDEHGSAPVRDDVDPADAAEQQRSVPLDEDDYR